MPELVLHARPVATVFDLLGHDENDMTAALGWGLAHSHAMLRRFAERVLPGLSITEPVVIELQQHDQLDAGFTDIEIKAPNVHAIVEAKRGWDPPSEAQMRRYEARFATVGAVDQRFVVLTQNGAEQVVRHRLGAWAPPPPISVAILGWSDLVASAEAASREGRLGERHLAAELSAYLRGVADMRETKSNEVYVVSLSRQPWAGWPIDLTPVDEIERHRMYHYPTVGSYPKIVPNYMGFRYDGKLQSVHHVDEYSIVDTPHGHIPGGPDSLWEVPHFLLRLGPPIRPDHEVRTGTGIVRSTRVTVDIDLLLTSATITEALAATRARRAA